LWLIYQRIVSEDVIEKSFFYIITYKYINKDWNYGPTV